MRLLDETGKQIGIVTKEEALKKAQEEGKDLVEISGSAKPPVVRLIEFKKFKYQEAKKEQDARKKAKDVELKEIRLRPFTDDHDLEVRTNQAKKFLKVGNKVKFAIKFSGREMTHPHFGFDLANKLIEILKEEAIVERQVHFEGRQLVFSLQPIKGKRELNDEIKK